MSEVRGHERRMTCGFRPTFTCAAACAALGSDWGDALQLPASVDCDAAGAHEPDTEQPLIFINTLKAYLKVSVHVIFQQSRENRSCCVQYLVH